MTKPVRAVGESCLSLVPEVEHLVASHGKLTDVVKWLSFLGRKDGLIDVVKQDEYTHDVVVRLDGANYLVYGVT